jgi:Ice-binding-like
MDSEAVALRIIPISTVALRFRLSRSTPHSSTVQVLYGAHEMINKKLVLSPLVVALAALLCIPASGAQVPVDLRSAGNFVILSKSGITDVPASAIMGNIGTSPITGAAITGIGRSEVAGRVYTVDAAGPAFRVIHPVLLTAAIKDMETAYTDAAGRVLPNSTELGAGNIDGMTLSPGLYKWGTSLLIPTGVTLDAQGNPNAVWIFQVAQSLIVGNGAIVTLSGGAKAKNIFWQVAGQTTLGTTADFKGIILCKTAIALQTGATLDGRAMAQTAVTLQKNDITQPTN